METMKKIQILTLLILISIGCRSQSIINAPEKTDEITGQTKIILKQGNKAYSTALDSLGYALGIGSVENKVVKGSWLHQQDYDFHVEAYEWVIENNYTVSFIEDDISLSAADVTNDRIDVVVVNDDETFSIITGEPSATPFPTNAEDTQAVLFFILVKANSTAPVGVQNIQVYDETTGEPNEWTSNNYSIYIDVDYTGDASTGVKSIRYAPLSSNASNCFLDDEIHSSEDVQSISFDFKWESAGVPSGINFMQLYSFEDGTTNYHSLDIKTNDYGLDVSDNTTWQRVVIPTSDFLVGMTSFDKFCFGATQAGLVYLIDNWSVQKIGDIVTQPNENIQNLSFNDTTNILGISGGNEVDLSSIQSADVFETIDEGNGDGIIIKGRDALNYGNIGLRAVDLSYSNSASSTSGATGISSFAFGDVARAEGDYSFAFGDGSRAEGDYSFAFGDGSRAPNNYSVAIGDGALADADFAFALGENNWARGNYSVALGYRNVALGDASFAFGYDSVATGNYSFTFGDDNHALGSSSFAGGSSSTATGNNSFAFGNGATTSQSHSVSIGQEAEAFGLGSLSFGAFANSTGDYSTAFTNSESIGEYSFSIGLGTRAESYAEISMGEYNTLYTPNSTSTFDLTDRLFNIGNGTTVSLRSDAFTILKNGTVTAPSLTDALVVSGGNQSLVTLGYFNANVGGGGSESTTVSDTTEIDLTLTVDDITADINVGSIDETKLDASTNASLDLADIALQSSDINTFAKLNAIVANKSLVNLEDDQSFDGVQYFSNGLEINVDEKLILDSGGDEWSFLLHDDLDVYGFNNGMIFAAAGGSHHFIEGETSQYAPIFSSGYNVDGKTNADVVLGGGGTKLLSEFALKIDAKYKYIQVAISDLTSDLTTGTNLGMWSIPYDCTLVDVHVELLDAGTVSGITVDINENGTTVLSTKLTTDATENGSDTATTPAVISDATLTQYGQITFDIDATGTALKGAIVTLKVEI